MEVKDHYAKLLSDISIEKYKVFDHNEPYLATKHIGKAGIEYEKRLEERNLEIAQYNKLVNEAMKTQCIDFNEAMDLKKRIQEKIREVNKLVSIKNQAVEVLKKECEKLKAIINGFRKPQQSKQQKQEENRELERSIEESAKEIRTIRGIHNRLENEINSKLEAMSEGNRREKYLRASAENVMESANNIQDLENRIEKLQEKKQALGLFHNKEKKALDEQIGSFEHTRQQAIEHHRRTYDSEPSQAPERAKEVLDQAKDIKEKTPKRTEIESLQESQQRVELKYKIELLWLEQRPDKEQIEQLLNRRLPSLSMKEQFADARLKQITKSDLEKIRKANPQKEDLLELVKQKEFSMRQPGKSRGKVR